MSLQSLPPEYYDAFLSTLAKERKPSPSTSSSLLVVCHPQLKLTFSYIRAVRGLYPLEARPGMISLLAGKPNAATFPFTSLTIKSRSPGDPAAEATIEIAGAELAEGLQYGPTAGQPSLIGWFYGLQEREHGRKKGEGWGLSIGSGSQDVLHKAILALLNPGDPVLVESPLYA